jgi:hypothetical protein
MKKNIIRAIIALGLAVVVYFGLKPILFPTMAGSKSIDLTIVVDDENGGTQIFNETVHTDSETLGELLEEVDTFYDDLTIEYNGAKTDAWGRMIISINDNATLDMATGPWWMINSDNNKDCLEAGFCNGIDLQSIYDQDHFELDFTSSY